MAGLHYERLVSCSIQVSVPVVSSCHVTEKILVAEYIQSQLMCQNLYSFTAYAVTIFMSAYAAIGAHYCQHCMPTCYRCNLACGHGEPCNASATIPGVAAYADLNDSLRDDESGMRSGTRIHAVHHHLTRSAVRQAV